MTKQEQIEFIREKCIEVNPRIKNLGFGCELYDNVSKTKAMTIGENWYFGSDADYQFTILTFDKEVKIPYLWQEGDMRLYNIDYKEIKGREVDFKIIGRDIRLADVLSAIESSGYIKGLSGVMKKVKRKVGETLLEFNVRAQSERLNSKGWKKEFTLSQATAELIMKWNLVKDRLEDQSDETIGFIYNLLK